MTMSMSPRYYLPLALATLLQSSTPSAAFSPSPSLMHAKRHNKKLGYHTVTSLDEIDLSTPSKDVSSMSRSIIDDAIAEDEEDANFDWFKTWLPLMPVEFLDREKPTPFKLLGMDIVVFNDGEVVDETGTPVGFGSKKDRPKNAHRSDGTWRAFADRCPHRAAPLSEGRVEEDGTLMCSYHAWRWEGNGELAHVPQAQCDALDRMKKNSRSNCNAFPTKVKNGLLWVWPSSGSDDRILSELTKIPNMSFEGLVDEPEDESRVLYGPWTFRYVPNGWDYVIENLIDPAHTASAHHGLVSSRYVEPRPFHVNITTDSMKEWACEFTMNMDDRDDPRNGDTKFVDHVTAPGNLKIFTKAPDEGAHCIELYTSPGMPGFTNLSTRQMIIKTKDGKAPLSGRVARDSQIKALYLTSKLPKWFSHIITNKFLNQDALLVHIQERNLYPEYTTIKAEDEESDKYTDAILPMSADKGVIFFRKWVQNMSGGRTPYVGNPDLTPVDKEVVFDVYNSHTKYCSECLGALKNLRKFRNASFVIAGALSIWVPSFIGKMGTTALVALFIGAALAAQKVVGLMIRMEFSHPGND